MNDRWPNTASGSPIGGENDGAIAEGAPEGLLITGELDRRPSRPPDHQLESRAFAALGRSLGSEPDTVLQKVAETARTLCRADSTGISILETRESGSSPELHPALSSAHPGEAACAIFRWRAIAGAFAKNLMRTIPRDASPCARVIAHGDIMLLRDPARAWPELVSAEPYIHEAMLAPWSLDEGPVGTIWLLSHDPARGFDAEDARLLRSLAGFASAAWRTSLALSASRSREADLGRRVLESTAALRESRGELHRQARLYETALSTITESVFVFDLAGRLTFVNKPTLEKWGMRLEEALGRTFAELPYPPELAAELRRRLKSVVHTRGQVIGEGACAGASGPSSRYRYVFNPVLDSRGAVTGVAASTRDIIEK